MVTRIRDQRLAATLSMRTVARHFVAIAASFVAAFLTAAPALADAAAPIAPGDTVGVPSGPTQNVFIEHEDLSMDLSGLNPSNRNVQPVATVIAKYSLRNDGPAQGIDLVFVTASQSVAAVHVLLDGAPVLAAVGPLGPVPPSWQPPHGTPDVQGGPDLPYEVDRPVGLTFHVDLGLGRHTMMTSYQAVPTKLSGNAADDAPIWWQLAFVLSPARQWKGFGDLALTVRVPHGWQAAVRPTLTRQGDALAGDFTGVPADSIGVTTRMEPPPDWRSLAWKWGMLAVVVSSTLIGCLGARLIKWPVSLALLGASPVFAVGLAIMLGIAESFRSASVPFAQQSWTGGKGAGLASFVQVPAAFVAGLFIGVFGLAMGIVAGVAWRETARRASRR